MTVLEGTKVALFVQSAKFIQTSKLQKSVSSGLIKVFPKRGVSP